MSRDTQDTFSSLAQAISFLRSCSYSGERLSAEDAAKLDATLRAFSGSPATPPNDSLSNTDATLREPGSSDDTETVTTRGTQKENRTFEEAESYYFTTQGEYPDFSCREGLRDFFNVAVNSHATLTARVEELTEENAAFRMAIHDAAISNGGPIDAKDTCTGYDYVMIRRIEWYALHELLTSAVLANPTTQEKEAK